MLSSHNILFIKELNKDKAKKSLILRIQLENNTAQISRQFQKLLQKTEEIVLLNK